MNIDDKYYQVISENLNNTIQDTNIHVKNKQVGKVRDAYFLDDKVLMVSTDRQSAFDRVLARIPYKGVVLNLVSAWWFKKTKDMFPNHLISTPDPNISLVEKCEVFQVEFVVRGYITGSTETSLWTVYKNGAKEYCGNKIPSGLKKNQKLSQPMLTPTTKDKIHDRPVSKGDARFDPILTSLTFARVEAKMARLLGENADWATFEVSCVEHKTKSAFKL